jgi:hypothetical protein
MTLFDGVWFKKKSMKRKLVSVQQPPIVCAYPRPKIDNLLRKELKNFLPLDLKRFRTIDSLAPSTLHSFNADKIAKFIADEKGSSSWQEFFDVSQYIKFDEFVGYLKSSFDMLFRNMSGPFVLVVIPEEKVEDVRRKSNYWMTVLSLSILKEKNREPVAICTPLEAVFDFPEIENAIVLDDAVYTGNFIKDFLSKLVATLSKINIACPDWFKKRWYILVPICSVYAQEALELKSFSNVASITLVCANQVSPLRNLLEPFDVAVLAKAQVDASHFPVVLQHKLSDSSFIINSR